MRLFNKAHDPIPSLRELASRVSLGDGEQSEWFNGEPSIRLQLDARQHRQARLLLHALRVNCMHPADTRAGGFLEFPVKNFLKNYSQALRRERRNVSNPRLTAYLY